MKTNKFATACLASLLLGSCINTDLPYPVVYGMIEEIEAEGFVDAIIDREARDVYVTVADTIDLRALKLTKLLVTDDAELLTLEGAFADADAFPRVGFASLDSVAPGANTLVDLSQDAAHINVKTYQDYEWSIRAGHSKYFSVLLEDADGESVITNKMIIDEENRHMLVHVDESVDLNSLRITELVLGYRNGVVTPSLDTYTSLYAPVEFEVEAFDETEAWTVVVSHQMEGALEVDAWARRAYITGTGKSTDNIDIRYKAKDTDYWDSVFADEISYAEDGSFTASLRHLRSETSYEYTISINDSEQAGEFLTESMTQMPNSSFEDWWQDGRAWAIYVEGGDMFWDSGNWGSATIGRNITNYNETSVVHGKRSAELSSEYVVIKFAAGNIFTGEYVATDGTDGILDFGRPFTARPTALKGFFQYHSMPISHVSKDDPVDEAQMGMNDIGSIYIALGDWDSPVRIQTKKSDRKLFDKNDPAIIAYQEIDIRESVEQWQEFRLNLEYRSLTRKPTYIVVVASASKYGDFFTGGAGSKMLLDNLELVYE